MGTEIKGGLSFCTAFRDVTNGASEERQAVKTNPAKKYSQQFDVHRFLSALKYDYLNYDLEFCKLAFDQPNREINTRKFG